MSFNKKIKKTISKTITVINSYGENFFDSNARSLWFILFHGLVFGCFLQSYFSTIYNDSYFNFRFIVLLLTSIICFYLIWFLYAVALSKLFLGHLYISSIFEILKYDAFSYFPLTIMNIFGLILFFTHQYMDYLFWLLLAGIILTLCAKCVLFIIKSPDKDHVLARIKRKEVMEHIDNLDADSYISSFVGINNAVPLRRYIVQKELRNAINLKSASNGSFRISNIPSNQFFRYAIGFDGIKSYSEGNLKLFLTSRDNEELILDKDANNFMTGWNEYQIPIPQKLSSVDIRWENSIDENIYLAPMIFSSVKLKDKRHNIILIILDGLDSETLGLYRNAPNADNISRFFKDSIIFTNAYAQGEWTLPNFASIAQALYPKHHGIYDPDLYSKPMSTDCKTIAEILQEHGYNTLGVGSGPRATPGYGHARGFNRFFYWPPVEDRVMDHTNIDIISSALKFLKRNQNTNNFLFLHIFDTHYPYHQSPENASGKNDALFNISQEEFNKGKTNWNMDHFNYWQELYCQKFKEVDENLQLLFDYISKYEDDHTKIILTADHGTPLFDKQEIHEVIETGRRWKAARFIESELHVPFIIRLPTDPKCKQIVCHDLIEGNITLMPTILDIAGLKTPKNIDGVTSITDTKRKKIGKGYVIAESTHRTEYELFVKTPEFKYYMKTNRNRISAEILAEPGIERYLNSRDTIISSKDEIKNIKEKIKKILDENKLENVVTSREN